LRYFSFLGILRRMDPPRFHRQSQRPRSLSLPKGRGFYAPSRLRGVPLPPPVLSCPRRQASPFLLLFFTNRVFLLLFSCMGSRIVTVDNSPKDAVKVMAELGNRWIKELENGFVPPKESSDMTEFKNKLNAENNRVMPRLRIPLPSTKLQQHWLQLCLAGLD